MLIIRRSKLCYTPSGIITLSRWPSHAQVVHGTATYSDVTFQMQSINFWNLLSVFFFLMSLPQDNMKYKTFWYFSVCCWYFRAWSLDGYKVIHTTSFRRMCTSAVTLLHVSIPDKIAFIMGCCGAGALI